MTLSVLSACLAFGVATPVQSALQHDVRFRVSASGTSRVYAMFTVRPFDKRKHLITGKPIVKGGALMTFVDGKFAWGCGGSVPLEVPETALGAVSVHISGRTIEVPSRLVSDLYNVRWEKSDRDRYELFFGSTPGAVKMRMAGSDGYAGYIVTWTIGRDGKCKRSISGPGL